MLVQIVPLDSSEPNVIELERVYVAVVVASDDEHDVSLGVYTYNVCMLPCMLSACDGLNYPKWGVNYPSWIIRKRAYVA